MPQPNMQQMLKQVQKMQADMAKAQEELKNEVVEATVGGGVVTVEVTGELVVKSITIAPRLSIRTTSRCCLTWCSPRSTRGSQAAQELAAKSWARLTGGLGGAGGLGGLGLPGF